MRSLASRGSRELHRVVHLATGRRAPGRLRGHRGRNVELPSRMTAQAVNALAAEREEGGS
jgi:hypothetical protein